MVLDFLKPANCEETMSNLITTPSNVIEAHNTLKRALTVSKHRLNYQDAIELRTSARALWVRFYNAWFQETDLKTHAEEYRDLASQTITALRNALICGAFEPIQSLHVHAMITNTKLCEEGFSLIAKSTNRGATVNEIEKLGREAVEKTQAPLARAR
jgi:hypothetical protein